MGIISASLATVPTPTKRVTVLIATRLSKRCSRHQSECCRGNYSGRSTLVDAFDHGLRVTQQNGLSKRFDQDFPCAIAR
jgi:hypothetical protein